MEPQKRVEILPVSRPKWELGVLALIASIASFPFVIRGFAIHNDGLLYALGLFDILAHGIRRIPFIFNGDMSPAYYFLVSGLAKGVGTAMEISALMNLLNAFISVVLEVLLYVFFCSLSTRRWTPLFAALAFLLAPGIWMLSHSAHPSLFSITFFIGSLIVLDRIIRSQANGGRTFLLWCGFVLLTLAAMAMRLDIVLSFGAFLGLMLYRRSFSFSLALRGIAALVVLAALYAGFRYQALGYFLPAGGGSVGDHLVTRLGWGTLGSNVVKNGILWAMGANVLVFLLGVCGPFSRRNSTRLGVLMLLWMLPWCVFLPFTGMDFARISAGTIPVLVFAAVEFVGAMTERRPFLALCTTLVLAQLVSVVLFYPIRKYYPFTLWIDGRPIGDVPIGLLFTDHYYRQRFTTEQLRIAKEVTDQRGTNIAIVGYGVMAYQFYLQQSPDLSREGFVTCHGLVIRTYAVGSGSFFVCNLGDSPGVADPLKALNGCLEGKPVSIYIPPFSREAALHTGQPRE